VPSDPLPYEPLGKSERITALAVGVAAGGGGGYAVFASTNQAGTAILLILSAIFLLIGIQGTSLIRFSTGSNTVELERRRRIVEQAVKEAAKDDVERAEGIIEGAGLAIPSLQDFPFAEETLYVRRLELAISELGYRTSSTSYVDRGADITVRNGSGDTQLEVEVKYRKQSPLSPRIVRDVLHQYSDLRRYSNPHLPLLIVTNVGFSTVATAYARDAEQEFKLPIRLIQWRDSADNNALGAALAELFSSIQDT
jgi:hypothetical protein